jgi:hypothetical protein
MTIVPDWSIPFDPAKPGGSWPQFSESSLYTKKSLGHP